MVKRREFCGTVGAAMVAGTLGPLAGVAKAADDPGRAYLTSLAQAVLNLDQMREIAATKVRRGLWGWMSSGAELSGRFGPMRRSSTTCSSRSAA